MGINLRSNLSAFIVSFLVITAVNAQYVDVTINPFSAMTGTAVIMVEVPVADQIGIELQSSYFFQARRFWTPNYRTEGYRFGGLCHLYINENSQHNNFSIFAYFRHLNVRYESIEESNTLFDRDSYNLSQSAFGLGASEKIMLSEQFILGFGGGLGRVFNRVLKREEGNTGDFLSLGYQANINLDIYARITIGYRFGSTKA